jgi:hypothetical protein
MPPLILTGVRAHAHPILGLGPVYQRFFHFVPSWMFVTAVTALGAYLACRQIRPQLSGPVQGLVARLCRTLYSQLDLGRDWFWFACGCGILLLSIDYHGFTQGFFRLDDFAFIQDARERMPFLRLLNLYHNDHSLPLFRLWVSGIVSLLGPSASPAELARAFNIVNYVTCLGVLLGGIVFLSECAARRITAICFCIFAWSWPGWGEFTTGYYTLIVYPQTLVLGLASTTMVLRFLRSGELGWMLASVACALLASGLDISGMWVFPAVVGFAWMAGGWQNHSVRRLAPWLLVAFVLGAYYHLLWLKHPFEGREFEQNPSGWAVSRSIIDNLTMHFWRLPLAFASGVGGTFTSTIIPGFLGMFAPKFYGNAVRSVPVYVAEAMVLAGVGWLGWRQAGSLSPGNRRLFAAIGLPVLILIGMTSVARADELNQPGSFWPTKYFCVPHAWAALAAVFLMDRTALGSPDKAQRSARWIAIAVIGSIWMLASHWYLERALAIHAAYQPAGREGNVAAARLRREDYAVFLRDIETLSVRCQQKQLAVPSPDGMYWAHPFLEFGYDPKRGGTYRFTDLLSVAPVLGVTLQERPLKEIPPSTLRAIEGIPSLKRVFDPNPPASPIDL